MAMTRVTKRAVSTFNRNVAVLTGLYSPNMKVYKPLVMVMEKEISSG